MDIVKASVYGMNTFHGDYRLINYRVTIKRPYWDTTEAYLIGEHVKAVIDNFSDNPLYPYVDRMEFCIAEDYKITVRILYKSGTVKEYISTNDILKFISGDYKMTVRILSKPGPLKEGSSINDILKFIKEIR